jgi:hypothetical protein
MMKSPSLHSMCVRVSLWSTENRTSHQCKNIVLKWVRILRCTGVLSWWYDLLSGWATNRLAVSVTIWNPLVFIQMGVRVSLWSTENRTSLYREQYCHQCKYKNVVYADTRVLLMLNHQPPSPLIWSESWVWYEKPLAFIQMQLSSTENITNVISARILYCTGIQEFYWWWCWTISPHPKPILIHHKQLRSKKIIFKQFFLCI